MLLLNSGITDRNPSYIIEEEEYNRRNLDKNIYSIF